jgi:hypothetical protein
MAEGLLHLGAMAVLTGIVYLNLDKASPKPEDVATTVETLRERVRIWSKEYDPEYSYKPDNGKKMRPSRSYDSGTGYFLLSFAKNPACKHFPRYQRWAFGSFNFFCHPASSMIGDGYHAILIGLLTALSAICFFCQIGGHIFEIHYYLIDDQALFIIYTVTVILTLCFARLSRRISSLEAHLEIKMSDLTREKKHEDEKVRGGMRDDASASSTSITP